MNDTDDRPPEQADTANFYGIVPRSVLTDSRLSMLSRVLYALLDSRQTSASRVRITQRLLADDLGVSVRTIGAALAELVAAGWLSTGRTGRSSSYRLVNPSRLAHTERQAKRLLQRLEEPTATERPAVSPMGDTGATERLSALLRADRRELIDLTTRTCRTATDAAMVAGWTLTDIAEALNGMQLERADRPGALLATRLKQLAGSPSPQQQRAEQLEQRKQERERESLVRSGALACQHGEPRGPEACAICRKAAADTAVGIAAALKPDGTGADRRARESLADLVVAADPPADELLVQLVDELAGAKQIDAGSQTPSHMEAVELSPELQRALQNLSGHGGMSPEQRAYWDDFQARHPERFPYRVGRPA